MHNYVHMKSFKNDNAIFFLGIEENLLHNYEYDAGNKKELSYQGLIFDLFRIST